MDRVADSGPGDPSSIPLGEKKENNQKGPGGGPFKKKKSSGVNGLFGIELT